jgi:hypothetical protein
MNSTRINPATETPHDPETGEVHDDAPRPRRRPPTEAERAERDRFVAERAQLRRAEVDALRAIDPACETDDDPPVVWRVPARMGGQPRGVLLDVPRLSGRGKAGSRLVLAARSYDGAGPNGGEARDYVSAFVIHRDSGGYERRSVGVAIRREELREVARTLLEYATALDRHDAEAPR